MKFTHDPASGAAYVLVTDRKVARTVSPRDSVNIDLDEHGYVVGVEILGQPERHLPVAANFDSEGGM